MTPGKPADRRTRVPEYHTASAVLINQAVDEVSSKCVGIVISGIDGCQINCIAIIHERTYMG